MVIRDKISLYTRDNYRLSNCDKPTDDTKCERPRQPSIICNVRVRHNRTVDNYGNENADGCNESLVEILTKWYIWIHIKLINPCIMKHDFINSNTLERERLYIIASTNHLTHMYWYQCAVIMHVCTSVILLKTQQI